MNDLLIIFAKNARAGHVKTRLAEVIGDEQALAVYLKLVDITAQTIEQVNVPSIVYYSDNNASFDSLSSNVTDTKIQEGKDLGERMFNAFKECFALGYHRIVLIGTDCPTLTNGHIHQAFNSLKDTSVVLGPAEDGGYYLIGLKLAVAELFEGVNWSSPTVLRETIERCSQQQLTFSLLPTLRDLDTFTDLIAHFPQWNIQEN